ncbi:MAG: dihydrolipoamide acetyltransferase family protein [Solirubrobacteraceae bacterium]
MAEELVMPRLSDTMEEGTIGRWLVHEGDAIKEGDVIAEIETDKATMEFQAYEDGPVLKILVGDGQSAPLGAPIALVGQPGEEVADAPSGDGEAASETPGAGAAAGEAPKRPGRRAREQASEAPPAGASGNGQGVLKVSPIARRMAEQAGLDLRAHAGRGSGPDGRIVKADIERLLAGAATPAVAAAPAEAPAAAAQPVTVPEGEVRELTPMLKAVAARMSQAKQTVPHFYVSSEIDMTRAVQLRAELNELLEEQGEKISLNDLIVRACAMSLMEHPQAHRSYVDGRHIYHAHANVGVAVALDDGLVVPVIFGADTLSVREIARQTRDLAGRAREGKLKQREIEGGTFTVSNMGMFDVASFSAIINPPESAILAVGSVIDRPAAEGGQVVVRSMMNATLACDHRACSGADGARLLQTVKRYLQAPAVLLA